MVKKQIVKSTIRIQRLAYNKNDFKIKGLHSSPAGTLQDWKNYSKQHKLKLIIDKKMHGAD